MILGKDTNRVYLSKLLISDSRFALASQNLISILQKHNIPHTLIEGTKDIWCRDYMPIQVGDNFCVQFKYEPSYLKDFPNLQSEPREICMVNGINPEYSKINLDGGNIVNWSDRAIITDRVFDENPSYQTKSKLVSEIEELLKVEIIVIPQIKSDMTGHADGYVRFLNRDTILGNDRNNEFKYWVKGMNKVLKEHRIEYIDIPFFSCRKPKFPDNAIGCYLNFLEVKDLILMPIFDEEGNRDDEVLELLKKYYPDRNVETINYNEVGLHGGLLNCTTWTVKE